MNGIVKRIVLALGGNALGQTPQEQIQLVKKTAKSIVDLVEEGYEIVCICPWSQNAIYAVSGMWRDVAGIYWIPLAAGNPV